MQISLARSRVWVRSPKTFLRTYQPENASCPSRRIWRKIGWSVGRKGYYFLFFCQSIKIWRHPLFLFHPILSPSEKPLVIWCLFSWGWEGVWWKKEGGGEVFFHCLQSGQEDENVTKFLLWDGAGIVVVAAVARFLHCPLWLRRFGFLLPCL